LLVAGCFVGVARVFIYNKCKQFLLLKFRIFIILLKRLLSSNYRKSLSSANLLNV